MNFYQHQDDARKKSTQLVWMLCVAVICLIFITSLGVSLFIYFFQTHATSIHAAQAYNTSFAQHFITIIHSEIMLWISFGVIGVVVSGSMFKANALKKGGSFVAESLGGKPLLYDNANAKEKRLLNIVEEMAIASGTPVPQVYLLNDESLNAFAAGTHASNAVIGITRGCIEALTRNQLQGVIAHEFSHIHHGDMKLNMRLIAVLHGILLIGLIGQLILRSTVNRRRYSSSRKGKNGTQLAVLGLGLMAIGFGGTFFGNLIKSAVSRQREYLADASAVQYTRSASGIAGALYKIKQNAYSSHLSSTSAAEFSHFYFANGVTSFLSGLFATHPKIDERINRIFPLGIEALESEVQRETLEKDAEPTVDKNTSNINHIEDIITAVGTISPLALQSSRETLAGIPPQLYQACHTPFQARAVVYALLLDRKPEVNKQQENHLKKRAHPATYKEFIKIKTWVANLDNKYRLPLLQLTLPSLNALSVPQKTLFENNMKVLCEADRKITVFEWALLRIVTSHLNPIQPKESKDIKTCRVATKTLLSFVAKLNDARHQQESLTAALHSIWPNDSNDEHIEDVNISSLDAALDLLKGIKPLHKPQLIKALIICTKADGYTSTREHEVLRAISTALDCPIPLT